MTNTFLKVLLVVVSATSLLNSDAEAASGEEIFKTYCTACHTVGGGRLVGPDLAGVHDRHSQTWLEAFVKSPKAMISSGDKAANDLLVKFNNLTMPDPGITGDEIKAVLNYLKIAGAEASGAAAAPVAVDVVAGATEADVERGQALFQGHIRFENRGPTCNTCHDVKNDAVIGGGVLAKELTTVFSTMGGSGVKAILGSPPFPVMQAAYEGRELTDPEIFALIAFLKFADEQQFFHQPRDYGVGLFVSGLVGTILLFGFYALMWHGRKKKSVNEDIFARQLKSTEAP